MYEDYAAARVVMKSAMPFVWVPAHGVIMNFLTSKYELAHYLKGANPVCDYLYETAVKVAEENSPHKAWSRVIWDVVAVAFLVAKDRGFMYGQIKKRKLPCYEGYKYEDQPLDLDMFCIEQVDRDPLMSDMFDKITK